LTYFCQLSFFKGQLDDFVDPEHAENVQNDNSSVRVQPETVQTIIFLTCGKFGRLRRRPPSKTRCALFSPFFFPNSISLVEDLKNRKTLLKDFHFFYFSKIFFRIFRTTRNFFVVFLEPRALTPVFLIFITSLFTKTRLRLRTGDMCLHN